MQEDKYTRVLVGIFLVIIFALGIKFGSVYIKTYKSIKEIEALNNTLELQIKDIQSNKLKSNIKITANHLGDIDGYTSVYKDEERDVQYLIKNEKSYTTLAKQEVSIEGLRDCKICDAGSGYFIVETATPDLIENGMSGRVVTDKYGNEIGFIIELLPNGKLKCLTME